MGFDEMPTNQYVESSFWNFDALFQPQQHPARDAHDTFFVSDPKESTQGDKELWERVKNMHEKGGVGSIGYKYNIFRIFLVINGLTRKLIKISSEPTQQLCHLSSFGRLLRNTKKKDTFLKNIFPLIGLE